MELKNSMYSLRGKNRGNEMKRNMFFVARYNNLVIECRLIGMCSRCICERNI